MTTATDLKKCPFCAGVLRYHPWGYSHPYEADKPCPLNGIGWDNNSENFKVWNTRVGLDSLDDRQVLEKFQQYALEDEGLKIMQNDVFLLLWFVSWLRWGIT